MRIYQRWWLAPLFILIGFVGVLLWNQLERRIEQDSAIVENVREHDSVKAEVSRRRLAKSDSDTGGSTTQQPKNDAGRRTLSAEKTTTVTKNFQPTDLQNGTGGLAQNAADTNQEMTSEKSKEWQTRKREFEIKQQAYDNKLLSLSDAVLQDLDDENSLMLSVIRLLSPEQLEQVRQYLLQTHPSEEVEAFLNDLNNATKKTPEQITDDAQTMLTFREAYKLVQLELDAEEKALDQERKELYGTE